MTKTKKNLTLCRKKSADETTYDRNLLSRIRVILFLAFISDIKYIYNNKQR